MLLDQMQKLKRLDPKNVLGSVECLGLQFQQAWDEARKVKIPKQYRKVDNILINGMGGSALGSHLIEVLYGPQLKVPLKVINSYTLPGFVNNRTLYVMSSYSGTTEEVIRSFNQAKKRRAKILVISAGGDLAKLSQRHKLPGYIFDPRFNPSGQPRMGLGYSIAGQMALLAKCGLLKISDNDFKKSVGLLIKLHKKFGVKVPARNNVAKKTATALLGKLPVYVAAEHLSGNAHIFANQTNETAKAFANYHLISELNHHLMEGLKYPLSNKREVKFLFLESASYLPRIQKRFRVTKKVLEKNSIKHLTYKAVGKTKLEQSLEIILFGSYVTYYMAVLNNLNPSKIPYVDYFKRALGK